MATEIHKHTVRMLWTGWNTLDIVTELQRKFELLGDRVERELLIQVGQLREQVKEARELAPVAAEQMFRDGCEWKEVIDALSRPYLLSSFEIDGIVSRAQAAVKATQAEPKPVVPVAHHEALNQQLIDAALRANPNDPTLLGLVERIQTDRAAHERVQERLQQERDERKTRGFE